MTADNFDNLPLGLQSLRPFQFYTVELVGGRRFEVGSPTAMVVRGRLAVFLSPGGVPV